MRMVLRMNELAAIENPRGYTASAVEELRALLTAGAQARRDPHRDNFYEIDQGSHTFYIHISPVNGNVVLLAAWSPHPQDTRVAEAPQTA